MVYQNERTNERTEDARTSAAPSCEEGQVVETEGFCGEYEADWEKNGMRDFNRVLEECRAGVFQEAGCTCGAERADESQTFPGEFLLYTQGNSEAYARIQCVARLALYGVSPSLPSLEVVNGMYVEDVSTPWSLPAVRRIGDLAVRGGGDIDFRDFSALEEMGGLFLAATQVTSLQGLEVLTEMNWLDLRGNRNLRDLSGLRNVVHISGMVRILESPEQGLRGLENLRSVGLFSVPIRDAADLAVLSNLREVHGDLSFTLPSKELWCAAHTLLEGIKVDGRSYLGTQWDDLDASDCEG